MPDGPLLGNGDVGIVLAGPPEAQAFYIGKNDFWTRTPGDAKVIAVGQVHLIIPALQGADVPAGAGPGAGRSARDVHEGQFDSPHAVMDGRESESTADAVAMRRRAARASRSGNPRARRRAAPRRVADSGRLNVGREQHGGGRWYFHGEIADVVVTGAVLSGKPAGQPRKPEQFDGKTTWRELAAPKMDKSVSVAAWIKIAGTSPEANYIVSKGDWNHAYSLGLSNGRLRWAINGTFVQSKQPVARDKWVYVAGTFDGRQMCLYVDGELQASLGAGGTATGWFTRKADGLPGSGREVAVVSRGPRCRWAGRDAEAR